MTKFLVLLALLWPLFYLVKVLLVSRILLGLEFRPTRVVSLPPNGISPHIREAAGAWSRQLEGLEFRQLGGWRLNTAADPALEEENVVLVHPSQPVRALIVPREESALSGECWVSLRTTLEDGTEIVTNTHSPEAIIPACTGIEVELVPTTLVSDAWQRHLARIAAATAPAWTFTDLASVARRERDIRDACLNDAVHGGLLARHPDGGVHYRPLAAVKQALRVIQTAAKNKKAAKNVRVPATTLTPESLAAFDLYHYRQMIALGRGRFSLRTKAVISSVSFLVFAGVLAWQYSLTVAVTLVIALIFHEGGHLLGMKLFGFRDTQLLFVPFFGGAAIGHDDKVLKPWQHIVIILLGPLPGIFAGLGMLVYASGGNAPAWINEAALTTIVLNAFNLLPVLPLDGGQIVDFAVASRFPRARVLFLGASAFGLLLFGYFSSGISLLFGLGVASLMRLPVEWRLAGVRRDVREEYPDGGNEEPIVGRLLEHMREPEWAKTPSTQRLQLVRGLQRIMRMPRPGIGTMCFALAAFTCPVWLGTPLAIWSVLRQGDAQVRQAEARAEAAGLTARRTAPAPVTAIAPGDNAAVTYARVEATLRRTFSAEPGEGATDDAKVPTESTDNVALLRLASHQKAFVPVPAPAPAGKRRLLGRLTSGLPLSELNRAAEEKMRYHESNEAAAIAADSLRLMRLMQAAPGFLDWDTYYFHASTAWNTIEEALASEAKPSAQLLQDIGELSAEQPVIDFASRALPRSLLGRATLTLGPDYEDENPDYGRSYRILMLTQRLSPAVIRMRVQQIDQAVAAQDDLRKISHGTWPKAEHGKEGPTPAQVALAQLADLIARQRQARVALQLVASHVTAQKDRPQETVARDSADWRHPSTGEKLQINRRGTLDVLTFHASAAQLWQDDEDRASPSGRGTELVWRVPAPSH